MSISGAKPGVKLAYQGVDLGAIVLLLNTKGVSVHNTYAINIWWFYDWKQMFKTIQHLET